MPYSPTYQPRNPVLGVRLEPAVLRQVHQLAVDRELTISGAARHLLALGLETVKQPA